MAPIALACFGLALISCASTQQERRLAHLEGQIQALQEQYERRVDQEVALRAELEPLRAEVHALRLQRSTPSEAAAPEPGPSAGPTPGSLDEYKALYRDTGRLLDAVYQERGDLDALGRDFLRVNYQDGLLHPEARRRYVSDLRVIRHKAEVLAAQCRPAPEPADDAAPDSAPQADPQADR